MLRKYEMEQVRACLRLFRGYKHLSEQSLSSYESMTSQQAALEDGIIITEKEVESVVYNEIKKLYSTHIEEFNNTFHKSFRTVRDSNYLNLCLSQLLHYLTTYGFEQLGIKDSSLVYIPKEQQDLPKELTNLHYQYVKYMTDKDITIALTNLLTSGVAFSESTIRDIKTLKDYIDLSLLDNLQLVKNKQVKLLLYYELNIIPENNMEFLRYLVYIGAGETQIVKNNKLYCRLKHNSLDVKKNIANLLINYVEKPDGYEKLGEIFLRYRKLFISLKWSVPETYDKEFLVLSKTTNTIINRLRHKYADKYHRSCKNDDGLVNITAVLKSTNFKDNDVLYNLYKKHLKEQLDKVSLYKTISIYNGIKYLQTLVKQNLNNTEFEIPKVYKIRNGKVYVQNVPISLNWCKNIDKLEDISNFILNYIRQQVYLKYKKEKVTIVIPKNIEYACPTSEKAYVGFIPCGTKIKNSIKEDGFIIGVHWTNVPCTEHNKHLGDVDNEIRVDLDFHLSNTISHIGWNGDYRSENVLYSGDLTNAPLPIGATECMYIASSKELISYILTLNVYNADAKEVDIPYTLFICKGKKEEVEKNYVYNPDNLLAVCNNVVLSHENNINLGQFYIEDGISCFVFDNGQLSNSNIQADKDLVGIVLEHGSYYKDTVLQIQDVFNDNKLFEIKDETFVGECDIDLRLEKLTKNSFIDIFNKKEQ